MQKNKKVNKKKKLLIASSILLAGGVVGSIGLSQISFATNSFDNNIKMLSESEDLNLNSGISTYGEQNNQVNDSEIGLKVGGYTPFWNSDYNGYWVSQDGYKYFQAPKAEGYAPSDQSILTNPGVAMAWYPNNHDSGDYNKYEAAGPGMFTFYTRQLEDYFYSANNNGFSNIFLNEGQKQLFKDTFFKDIKDIGGDSFQRFVTDIVSPQNNFGTKVSNIQFRDKNKDGSVLSHLLFRNFTLPESPDTGPNIQLSQLVFYPSNNNPPNRPSTVDPNINTKYNKVYVGNEPGQAANGNGIDSPTKDYNNKTNSALLRATTLDSFTLVTTNRGGDTTYRATGNIKFRIFYEYDFLRDANGQFNFNMNDLVGSQAYLEDYLTPSDQYETYKNDINSDTADKAYTVNKDKFKQLIIAKYQSMMKNLSYSGSDAGSSPLSIKALTDGLSNDEIQILDPTDITIDGGDLSSITLKVKINVEPVLERNITFKFNKRKSAQVISNTATSSNSSNIVTPSLDEAQAKEVIQNNLDQILSNATFNNNKAIVTKINGLDTTSRSREGIIQFDSMVLNNVVVNGNILNDQTYSPISGASKFEITGFKQATAEDLESSVASDADLSQLSTNTTNVVWNSVLPQTLSNDNTDNSNKDTMINNLKTVLVENQLIKNPSWAKQIANEDIQISVNRYDNINGTAQISVVLKNHYDSNGVPVNTPSEPKTMNLTGLMTLAETTAKTDISIVDDINQTPDAKKFASEITNEDIQRVIDSKIQGSEGTGFFLNNPIKFNTGEPQLTNNTWLKNTEISLSSSKQPVVNNDNGSIQVFAEYSPYQSTTNVVSQPAEFSFTLTGYLNKNDNGNQFTTTVSNGALTGVNEIIPDTVIGNEDNIKQAIISGGFIQNLAPSAGMLQPSDITLSNLQPISKDGSLICDVTIDNSKAWINGEIKPSETFANVQFSGFKQQLPTTVNTSVIDLGLSEVNLENIQTEFATSVLPLLQTKVSEIVNNQYPNSTIDFAYDPTGVDLANGTLKVNVNITNGIYDSNGNSQPNGTLTQSITLSGFMKSNTYSTSLNPNITINGYENQIGSVIKDDPTLMQQLKDLVVKNIINPNPGHVLSPEDVTITVSSVNNITGSLNLSVVVNKDACMVDGVIASDNQTYTTSVSGFKKMQAAAIGDLNTPDIFDKNQDVNSFINNPNTIKQIKDAILNPSNQGGLKPDMFPNGLPSAETIGITFNPVNPIEGSCTVNVTIPGPYVGEDGSIVDGEFTTSFNLSGFKPTVATTSVVDNPVIMLNDVIASDASTNLDKIKEAIVNAQSGQNSTPIFNNLTSGKTLTIDDIVIEYVADSYNNLNATAQFNITLKNGVASENGQPQDKTFNNVTIGGFKKLQITNLNGLELSLGSIVPSDFIKNPNAINEIKLNIIDALKNNPKYNGMFPNGLPTVDDIEVTINGANDDSGQVSVNISVSNVNYVPEMIESPVGSGNYIENKKGEIVVWTPQSQPYMMNNINLTGFQQGTWAQKHWLIITLASIGAVAAIILIVLLILKVVGRAGIRRV